MYFSLITLTTVGYGDIVPIGRWVMVLANFEAMAGAIFLTVIVARLVSLYGNSE
jgi:voltage-gated potassium channel Kch